MGTRLVLLALSIVTLGVVLGACGKEIGDSCLLSSDCSPNGDRVCLCSYCTGIDQSSDQGYCTVLGCDYSTCPEESACIRFFTGGFTNPDGKMCGADVPADMRVDCSLDELCAINGHCVPRSSEVRYCMRKCDSSGDCRDGYECRDFALAQDHGGEALLAPGVSVDAQHSPKFCAAKPPT